MFDKSIALNMALASKEFGIGLAIGALGFVFILMGGLASLVALAALLASLIFFVMGFIKLFYKSLFSDEAYLYMSLPISNLQVVLGKIFAGTFWLMLGIGLAIGAVMLPLAQSDNLFEMVVGTLLVDGVPAEKMGLLMVGAFWSYVLGNALFTSSLLFAIILTNTLSVRRFKIALYFIIFSAIFAAIKVVFDFINKRLERAFDTFQNAFEMALLSLGITFILLVLFIFLSERLLTLKYKL